jgi:hypothetical protein
MKVFLMYPGDDYLYGNPEEYAGINTPADWFLCGIGFTILAIAFLKYYYNNN